MTKCLDLLDKALIKDNSLLSDRNNMSQAKGFDTEYLEYLGLDKGTLIQLERRGRAMRARTKNIWVEGEDLPVKKGNVPRVVRPGETFRGQGSRLKWVILEKEK